MAKSIRRSSKVLVGNTRKVSPRRSVEVGRNHVIVKYHLCGKEHTLRLSKDSILANGRAALAKVPVIID